MAPNDRQERRRMRERGAGITRDLKNTDFAFAFGANQSQKQTQQPARKTPRASRGSVSKPTPASSRQTRSRRTPASKGGETGTNAEPRTDRSSAKRATPVSATAATARGKRSSKTPSSASVPSHTTQSVTGKRKRNDEQYTASAADEQDELEQEDVMEAITGRRSWGEQIPAERRKQPLDAIEERAAGDDELLQDSSLHSLPEARRVSLSIDNSIDPALLEASAPQPRPMSRNGSGKHPTTDMPPRAKTPVNPRTKLAARSSRKAAEDDEAEGVDHEIPAESHSTFIRRMYKPREPLRTLDGSAAQFRAPVANMIDPALLIDPSLEAEPSTATAVDMLPVDDALYDFNPQPGTPLFVTPSQLLKQVRDEIALASPVRGRKRQKTASPSPGPSSRDALPNAESRRTKEKKAKKTEKVSKKAGRSTANPSSQQPTTSAGEAEQGNARRRPATTTVPITVYRLSQPVTLGRDDDDDELNESARASLSSRGLPPVNPVDVLNQVTGEVIEHMAETAHRLPSTATSRRTSTSQSSNRKADAQELKRKRAILHHFKQSLTDSLFDITTALDAGTVLATRLKALMKEKIQLRDELLAVRAQREEVALKIDRVRRDHAAWRGATTRRDELSADLWDLEMAVRSGREECSKRKMRGEDVEPPAMGVRMLAASVAEAVAGAVDGGGLCGEVTMFNETLERVAGILEGRVA